MVAKLAIEEVRARGLERGFTLLSDTYLNNKSKLRWQCKNGHITYICFSNTKHIGCSICSGKLKPTLEEVRAKGLKSGFTLLSDTYINSRLGLQWLCKNGHTIRVRFSTISRSYVCPFCSGIKKITIERVRDRGLKNGFVLLSESYLRADCKLLWKCKNGHVTQKSLSSVSRSEGCSICSQKYDKAQSELYQFVLGMYPDALYNKSNILKNKKFELDVYIPSLKKAIELDGEYWHSLPGAIERDLRKNKECQEAGIQLLRLGYMEHWHEKQDTVGKPMVLQFLTSQK